MSELKWIPTRISVGRLTPWERNPKTMSKANAERLLANWNDLSQWQTLAIGPNGEVYDGHQRLAALKAAGYGDDYEVAVMQALRPLTDDERGRIAIEGTVGSVGQLDWALLASFDDMDLEAWGLGPDTLRDWQCDASALALMLRAAEPDPNEIYAGMPGYTEQNHAPYRSIRVDFASEADVADFVRRMDAHITPKTKSFWHPKREGKLEDGALAWVEDDSSGD